MPSGKTAYLWGIAAAGPRALSAEAVIQKRGDPAPAGIRLLRWDGRRGHGRPGESAPLQAPDWGRYWSTGTSPGQGVEPGGNFPAAWLVSHYAAA